MRRIQYSAYGGPEFMRLADVDLSPPREHEVCVRVSVASVNPVDWKLRRGEMKMLTGSKFPRAMGSDFSGTVEAVGSKVAHFKLGDEVVGTTPFKTAGAFAERVITSEKLLVKKPPTLSHAEAAVLPIPAVTAWLALIKKAKLRREHRVFINGALGGVGRAAIAIANDVGAKVAGRVGAAVLKEAQTLGLYPALDYRKPIPFELHQNFDVVFDCNGSLLPQESNELLRSGGIVIDTNVTGAALLRSFFSQRRKFVMFNGNAKNLQMVVAMASAGKLRLPIARAAKLDDAIPMLAELEDGHRPNGKAIIEFGP